jgi:hypothetical protein
MIEQRRDREFSVKYFCWILGRSVSALGYFHYPRLTFQNKSFYSGRPPMVSLAFIDRTTPRDYDEGIDAEGNKKPGCRRSVINF